jgi:hypothetical protein
MTDFYDELTRELHGFHDDTMYMSTGDIIEMLAAAATRVTGEDPGSVTVRPILDGGDVYHVLAVEDEGKLCLSADEIARLRAILCSYDEHATCPDDAQTGVLFLDDGRPVTTWKG